MGERPYLLAYVQNMDIILKVTILDEGLVFPKRDLLTHDLLEDPDV